MPNLRRKRTALLNYRLDLAGSQASLAYPKNQRRRPAGEEGGTRKSPADRPGIEPRQLRQQGRCPIIPTSNTAPPPSPPAKPAARPHMIRDHLAMLESIVVGPSSTFPRKTDTHVAGGEERALNFLLAQESLRPRRSGRRNTISLGEVCTGGWNRKNERIPGRRNRRHWLAS